MIFPKKIKWVILMVFIINSFIILDITTSIRTIAGVPWSEYIGGQKKIPDIRWIKWIRKVVSTPNVIVSQFSKTVSQSKNAPDD